MIRADFDRAESFVGWAKARSCAPCLPPPYALPLAGEGREGADGHAELVIGPAEGGTGGFAHPTMSPYDPNAM